MRQNTVLIVYLESGAERVFNCAKWSRENLLLRLTVRLAESFLNTPKLRNNARHWVA
jgi:hypothetical protein